MFGTTPNMIPTRNNIRSAKKTPMLTWPGGAKLPAAPITILCRGDETGL